LSEIMIGLRGLTKSYAEKQALRGLDLRVPRGSISGFLGRNGAGKTTTLKLLLGMLRPDAGEIRLFGETVDSEAASIAARRCIGFVSEDKELYPFMTVGQTIRFTRPFFPTWRRDLEEKYLDLFQLPLSKAVPKLSRGMRTQLMLLLAMARGAELLLMDEPTSALDPAITEDVLRELADLAASDGTTVFFSSHQLAEVEQICDRVCLIDEGMAVIDGELDELKARYRRILLVFDGDAPRELAEIPGVDHLHRRGRTASLLAGGDVDAVVEGARAKAEFGRGAPRNSQGIVSGSYEGGVMLWFKAWLETRWRFAFLVGLILLVWLSLEWITATGVHTSVPAARLWMGIQLGSVLLYIFTAIYLAGSGINSQTLYAATTGFHGSMLFTLSLPISRRRLLFARAGLGALLTLILASLWRATSFICGRKPPTPCRLRCI